MYDQPWSFRQLLAMFTERFYIDVNSFFSPLYGFTFCHPINMETF